MSFAVTESAGVEFYHTGESTKEDYDPKTFRVKPPEAIDRKVIAWDMEGISLSGQDAPQHPVLFGSSECVDSPLLSRKLTMREMMERIIEVGEKNPHAIHVGFAFRYDATMILFGMNEEQLKRLWKEGTVRFRFDMHFTWSVKWVPGKMFTITKRWGKKNNSRAKISVTIYDYSSFFGGQNFINTAEQILRDTMSDDDRDVIAHGKAARGHQDWSDMPEIQHYWSREILLIKRVFEVFRDVMYKAGFALKQWYGPGALANYINATKNLRPHMAGGQVTSGAMPAEVHHASKVAFSGGRFELFKAGRITGPISSVDINSAYPYALTMVPSLHPDNGEWHHVEGKDVRSVARFGVYRVRFLAPGAGPLELRPMPMFWRDARGLISYPQMSHGWYWSPEADVALRMRGAEILEGWEWRCRDDVYPWEFLQEMYDTRQRLGKKNLLSMPFKLGPNSLYGKYAQTVGWNQKENLPPKSHALPIAGWVTSYCRSMLYRAMSRNPESIIAVETDAVYTTASPDELKLDIGDGLGQWGYEEYDEMMYMQSGMYHYKQDGEWKGVRSRGMNRGEFPVDVAAGYLRSLIGGEQWGAISLMTKPRFIGLGVALSASQATKSLMTSWRSVQKTLTLGDTGKRVHHPNACPQCAAGISPYDEPHRLYVNSRSDGMTLSHPRRLPWEEVYTDEVAEIRERDLLEKDLMTR